MLYWCANTGENFWDVAYIVNLALDVCGDGMLVNRFEVRNVVL